jgi:hypothetical protein
MKRYYEDSTELAEMAQGGGGLHDAIWPFFVGLATSRAQELLRADLTFTFANWFSEQPCLKFRHSQFFAFV